LHLTLYLLWS